MKNYYVLFSAIVAIATLAFSFYKYFMMREKEALEIELNNLRSFFNLFEKNEYTYKKNHISYPSGIVLQFRHSLFSIIKKDVSFKLDSNLSVYDNFYAYIHSVVNYMPDSELNIRQMIMLYNTFINNLVQRDKLDQTFQILYSCIHGITSPYHVCKKEKRRRIERVQNSITSKQAIMYFFNQVQYAHRQRYNNAYIGELRRFAFFSKMFYSNEYQNIENIIPLTVEKMFYKQKNS